MNLYDYYFPHGLSKQQVFTKFKKEFKILGHVILRLSNSFQSIHQKIVISTLDEHQWLKF